MKQPLGDRAKPISRRNFLCLAGTLSLGVVTGGLPLPTEAAKFGQTLYKISESRLGMGTFINMIIFHPSKWEAEDAMGRAFEEINRLTSLMTRFQTTSCIGHLNASGYLNGVPPEVMDVLRSSLHYYAMSQGAFDITVKPLLDLYQQSFWTNNAPPSSRALKDAMERIGSQHLKLTKSSVSFTRSGMEVTMDGIAKGFIIDGAMDLLQKQGIQHCLINAGGDIVAHGGRDQGRPWRIAIQDPWNRNRYAEVITLNSGAVATSGNYEVFFDRDRLFHHLISPHRGIPAQNIASVSIRSASGMEADALTTAAYVMGPEKANRFIEQMRGVEGLIIGSHGQKISSSGWKRI